MKKLILITVLLFNVNAIAEEYNVVCRIWNYENYFVIKDVESFELAQKIIEEIIYNDTNELYRPKCYIIKVKN